MSLSGSKRLRRLDIAVHVHSSEADIAARGQDERTHVALKGPEVQPVLDAGHAHVVGGLQRDRAASLDHSRVRRGHRWYLVREIEGRGPGHLSQPLLAL